MMTPQRKKAEALYVHVPFCDAICSYCDFAHAVYQKELVQKILGTTEITADNVWSNQRYAPTYVSLKWLPSGYRELPDNKGLALAADADAQPAVWGACLRVRRVLKYRPHCLG